MTALYFASPRKLPKPQTVKGRVVVLDIAFAADFGGDINFASTTRPFIEGLGERLAAWVDHHDHDAHKDFEDDERFILATKAQHGACPEMITPEMVKSAGAVDTVVAHVDLDGIYAAAKWINGGVELYDGADHDAWAVDTRKAVPSPRGLLVDHALRGSFRDTQLKRNIVWWLVNGTKSDGYKRSIVEAAEAFQPRYDQAVYIAESYQLDRNIAFVDARGMSEYDKTELLLLGQQKAPVSVVQGDGMISIAAAFDSGWNFVEILGLDGGMPTRVSLPESRLQEVLAKIHAVG